MDFSLSGGAEEALQRLLSRARATVETCDLLSCVVDETYLAAPLSRANFAAELFELERQLGGGPFREAVRTSAPVLARDLGDDSRWPRFGAAAAALGVRSAVAIPLSGSAAGVLCLFAQEAHAFDDETQKSALLFGVLVEAIVASVRDAEGHTRNLQAALRSREVIGQAQGILMERGRLTADEAFHHLRRASQRLNVKLKDLAADVVETGRDPMADVEAAIIPPNEVARSAVVRRYDVLDTPPDGTFDRIASLAEPRACGTPIAIVSIVDNDRIWFTAHHGTDALEIHRDPGLCASAILQDGPWIIEHASIDPRTFANPLVAGELGLQFYLGVPLRTHDGYNLGTLCVLDHRPRQATAREIAELTELAQVVVDELELRLAARRAVLSEARLRHRAERAAADRRAGRPPTA